MFVDVGFEDLYVWIDVSSDFVVCYVSVGC